ncbi:hypothetical protein ACIBI3_07150 [Actinomadura luteofluorescens]|uniref:hypothetical protein n=1 Tax=Actinomadura luteofluorescens TaxID=46163 RepID=UPI0034789E00
MHRLLITFLLAIAFTATGAHAASAAAANPPSVGVNALNTYNSGDDAGNDSWLEIDRSLNAAKGDGSPGSDIINEVSGASSGMSPGSSNGSLTGTSTDLAPAESDDE